MMDNVDLAEWDLDRIARLPSAVRVGLCALIFSVIVLMLFLVDTLGQQRDLERATAQELSLRTQFEQKQASAVNIDVYREQLKVLRSTFNEMLTQLPNKNEVPALLEDVSKTGIAAGLQFTLFEPATEKSQDFYAQLPIQIEVLGTYSQFALFVSRVSSLNRIVTMQDFTIVPNTDKTVPAAAGPASATTGQPQVAPTQPELKMTITAQTYRYMKGVSDSATTHEKEA